MPTQQEIDAALDTLYREVHVPAFFEKLANDYGIHPRDEKEAVALLEQAEQLHQVYAATPTKQASLLEKGGKKIEELLKKAGVRQDQGHVAVKAAAAGAAKNRPDLAAAVLTLQAATKQAA